MLKSMTGFGSREAQIALLGKTCVELRSTNHKFFDAVFHLPEGFLSLEDALKKIIESKIKRGRVTCAVNVIAAQTPRVAVNKMLLENYITALESIKKGFRIKDEVRLDTLIRLPGILSLTDAKIQAGRIGPQLKALVEAALSDLEKTRLQEGRALYVYLKARAQAIDNHLRIIRAKFKRIIKRKLAAIQTDEERASFLRATDITEEMERLSCHIINFRKKITKAGPIGKELDFIAQEMQREANTIGAKSSSSAISSRVVQVKSQIEKIREQVQNIE